MFNTLFVEYYYQTNIKCQDLQVLLKIKVNFLLKAVFAVIYGKDTLRL